MLLRLWLHPRCLDVPQRPSESLGRQWMAVLGHGGGLRWNWNGHILHVSGCNHDLCEELWTWEAQGGCSGCTDCGVRLERHVAESGWKQTAVRTPARW